MIKVHLEFETDRLLRKVTSPHPWIDPDGIRKFAILLKERLDGFALAAEKLKKDGWFFATFSSSFYVRNNLISTVEKAKESFVNAGITDIENLVFIDDRNYNYGHDYDT